MRLVRSLGTRSVAAASAVVLAVVVVGAPMAPVALAAPACEVTNTTTHTHKGTLQLAVNAAAAKQTLEVRGTCTGTTEIAKSLAIIGQASTSLGKPILAGPGTGRVLRILTGATVTISTLTVSGGDVSAEGSYPDHAGGGIRNEGMLTLRNVIVSKNKAQQGGGISTAGKLTLTGTTRLSGNTAATGGGLDVDGRTGAFLVTLTDKARINVNTATGHGAGIYSYKGRVLMSRSAQVDHNTATTYAGGLDLVQTDLTLSGSSSIHDNHAGGAGGGINLSDGTAKLTGDSTVSRNTSSGNGGGINTSDGDVVLKDRAAVHHNTSTLSGGGLELNPGNLTMSGSSSVHHNTGGYAGGVELFRQDATETLMVMSDTSAVYANTATDPNGVAGISSTGDLVMNDKSVVRNHVSTTARRAVEVYNYYASATPSITMKDLSRIRDNDLASGQGALTLYPACYSQTSATGTAARVVSNTPANVYTASGC